MAYRSSRLIVMSASQRGYAFLRRANKTPAPARASISAAPAAISTPLAPVSASSSLLPPDSGLEGESSSLPPVDASVSVDEVSLAPSVADESLPPSVADESLPTDGSTTKKVVVSSVRPSAAWAVYLPDSTPATVTDQLPSSSASVSCCGLVTAALAAAPSGTRETETVTFAFGSETPEIVMFGPSTSEFSLGEVIFTGS
ncbi:hypothetical protein GcLGCM259_2373 [Glutamicibacter creatinolyticus]|uniref:Uncharacterized protein n=1 Tax=Glutamicibacter creatinolyticus TaxID=162496 RepID=A0A5B7WXT0_9MICC|nr:hypothetical protein GcLGCM259_2373 [Glutamicibacter creatinolyticus]